MGDRLTVGRQVLALLIGVRIPISQHNKLALNIKTIKYSSNLNIKFDMNVQKYEFTPAIFKENGLFIAEVDKVDNIPFDVKERSVVNIPSREFGGNHKHPRWEAFIGIGHGLKLVWEENGSNKEEVMNPHGKMFLYNISPHIPHMVVNTSKDEAGILLEFASESQRDVQQVLLVKT